MRIHETGQLPRHLPALDGIRGIAIAMVLVTHSLYASALPKADILLHAGWAGVENSALALAEMAPLLRLPRACANGKRAPVERDDWKKAVDGLVSVGEAVAKEAHAKNMDAMLDLSEKLSNACAACHDLYRDVDLTGGVRCEIKGE